MTQRENTLYLSGELSALPVFSHACYGQRFCRFFLTVLRRSGAEDILPVLSDEALLPPALSLGDGMTVEGQLRTYSQRTEDGTRLVIAAFARTLHLADAEPENAVFLSGRVAREPVYRCTPLGREITDLFLEVPRGFQKRDFLPVIAWGGNARVAADYHAGDVVDVAGRLQSRVYQKMLPDGTATDRTAYEVSAYSVTCGSTLDCASGRVPFVPAEGI